MTVSVFPAQGHGCAHTSKPEEARQRNRCKEPAADRPQEADSTGSGGSAVCVAVAPLGGAFWEQHIFSCFLLIVFIFFSN